MKNRGLTVLDCILVLVVLAVVAEDIFGQLFPREMPMAQRVEAVV